jgi:diguanylate cyclase (GGDEF)-like protein/PAS domain S-box-containing protein
LTSVKKLWSENNYSLRMHKSILARHALKTRATLFTLLIFIISLWSLVLYASHMLRNDLYRMLAEHQDTTVSLLARQLNQEIAERATVLSRLAQSLASHPMTPNAGLQASLRQDAIAVEHFNGVFVTNSQGIAIADSATDGARLGLDYRDRDYIRDARVTDKVVIGQPVLGRVLNAPVVGMATSLRGPDTEVIGVVAGVIDLGRSTFLSRTVHPHFSKSGSYCVVDRVHRAIVLCSDKTTSLKPLHNLGASVQMERFLAGYEGSAIYRDALDNEMLASVRAVPAAQWFVMGSIPAEEAFAPALAMQQRMLGAALLLTLVVSALTWWMLRRQLYPLAHAAAHLGSVTVTERLPAPLPVTREDEVGVLIGAFNRLMGQLEQREQALEESEARFRLAFENANVGMCLVDLKGRLTRVNQQMCVLSGYSKVELESMDVNAIAHPDYKQVSPAFIQGALSAGEDHATFEKVYLHKDGHAVYGFVSSSLLRNLAGEPLGFISHVMDITERKRADEKLQLAASVFTHAREGIMITDAKGQIIDVNATFTAITGYGRDEVLGRNPRLLSSGRQDRAFYVAMWRALEDQGHWSGEVWNRRKDGEMYAEMLTISAVSGAGNAVVQYVALFSDITQRKTLEEQVQQLAFYDPLTHLPNRRLLSDRLAQALAHSGRCAQWGAIMFIDLDNFKPLNDAHGHGAGDLLLVEVAERLKRAVRGVDTVARIGGDEFVVVLGELGTDRDISSTQALALAQTLRLSLAEPYRLNLGQPDTLTGVVEHHCTASLGVVMYGPTDGDADQLLRWADMAMYQAKALGRNRVEVHQTEMRHSKA